MRPINLYLLTRISELDAFTSYEQFYSNRAVAMRTRAHDLLALRILVSYLMKQGLEIADFDGFFNGFEIAQIGKEFDLLKFTPNSILNIEIKSQAVDVNKIEKQLKRNEYYLKHINRDLYLYTFISETKEVYQLDRDLGLVSCSINTLCAKIKEFSIPYLDDISCFFRASDYLISPLTTPARFLKKEYFLTNHQEKIKAEIQAILSNSQNKTYFCIRGSAGTGKTLLLYDIATELSNLGRCCLIHCGNLSEGHASINRNSRHLDVVPAKQISEEVDLTIYAFVFVDEAQRMYDNAFNAVINHALHSNTTAIFCCDPRQTLSKKEYRRQISERISQLPDVHEFELTTKIRSNQELSDFINLLFDQNFHTTRNLVSCVDLLFVETHDNALQVLSYLKQKGYKYIHHTPSQYVVHIIDKLIGDMCTHEAIGQEFDKVVVIIDNNFLYNNDGRLVARFHPNPDYLFSKLLFQEVTRVREHLCILFVSNRTIFENVLGRIK